MIICVSLRDFCLPPRIRCDLRFSGILRSF